jgi:hypothetical protein
MAGTRWVRLDTHYFSNTKISAVSRDARDLHLASIVWTAEHEEDGKVPTHILKDLAKMVDISRTAAAKAAGQLVDAGLWDLNGHGWHVHDFEVMNRHILKAELDKQRTKWADAKAKARAAKQAMSYVESEEDTAVE